MFLSFQKERDGDDEKSREWNIKRPVKAYIQILPMWVDRKNILSNINIKEKENNYLVLIGWDVKVRKLLPRTKI